MTRAPGTCNTMGTASTMTGLVEAMGLTLPGASAIPAMDSSHTRMASACGARIVEMIREDLRPKRIVTPGAVRNGLVAYLALGGSTNAVIHLIALAGRAGCTLTLAEMDALARKVPVLANLYPSGTALMEDFYYAGGMLALLSRVMPHLDLDAMTVSGKTLGALLDGVTVADSSVIRDPDHPVTTEPTLAVLTGNLAPHGAVMKLSAADPALFAHRGRAIVFEGPADMAARIHRDDLEVDAGSVLVLRGAGPVGAPGMPEWGNLPIPKKLLKKGVRDMLRISDARMSGTHYGTCVLHVAPEAAIGGPLGLIETGDMITLDVANRHLDVEVSDAELARRKAAKAAAPSPYRRGYAALYQAHVSQADRGCDFDFLEGTTPTPEPPIF
jgi:dihydroxy-acid dehydratase